MMEDIVTGCVVGSIPGEATKGLWDPMDSVWMLLLGLIAIWGGDEIKEAMINSVAEEEKEVVARGEQSVSAAEKFAEREE